jgi:prepilin-type N-terminal cleavage/methylation domain-containing protein
MYKKGGFTILETIISIIIVSLISTIALWYFKNAESDEALSKDKQGLITLLEEARSLSISSKQAGMYGVRLQADRATLFKGPSYATSSDNKVHEFNSKVSVSNYSLAGGGSDIIFSRLNGSTVYTGTITLSLKNSLSSSTITVRDTGVIE